MMSGIITSKPCMKCKFQIKGEIGLRTWLMASVQPTMDWYWLVIACMCNHFLRYKCNYPTAHD